MEKYQNWRGNLDDLSVAAADILTEVTGAAQLPLSTRLLRDYITRDLLGDAERKGRELVFSYENLLRLVVTRLLLSDGWALGKIQEHFALSSTSEIEELFPQKRSDVLATLSRLRQQASAEIDAMAGNQSALGSADLRMSFSSKIAKTSSVQAEMREALAKLGIPEDGPATEDLKLIAIAPWFQALVQTERLRSLTRQEAEEIGAGVTAALITLILKRGQKYD